MKKLIVLVFLICESALLFAQGNQEYMVRNRRMDVFVIGPNGAKEVDNDIILNINDRIRMNDSASIELVDAQDNWYSHYGVFDGFISDIVAGKKVCKKPKNACESLLSRKKSNDVFWYNVNQDLPSKTGIIDLVLQRADTHLINEDAVKPDSIYVRPGYIYNVLLSNKTSELFFVEVLLESDSELVSFVTQSQNERFIDGSRESWYFLMPNQKHLSDSYLSFSPLKDSKKNSISVIISNNPILFSKEQNSIIMEVVDDDVFIAKDTFDFYFSD